MRDAVNLRGLQGVKVTLTALTGNETRTASTDATGGYHFFALHLGDYDLLFEKPGYAAATIHLVRVASSQASTADLAMATGGTPVSILWHGKPEDLWAADYGSHFDATRLAALPTARNIWAVLENQDRSTLTNAPQEGGFTTGVIALAGASGASWTQTSYRFDGINVTDPFETGKPLVYPDYAALQELQASTAIFCGRPSAETAIHR